MAAAAVASLATETRADDDDDESVDVTDACESRGDDPLLAGDARLGDASTGVSGWAAAAVERAWMDRSRSERPPAPADACGVTQNDVELITRLDWTGDPPSTLQAHMCRSNRALPFNDAGRRRGRFCARSLASCIRRYKKHPPV